jgi:hypothetical protein
LFSDVNTTHRACTASKIPSSLPERKEKGFLTENGGVRYPIAPFIQEVIQPAFTFVQILHSLPDPTIKQRFPAELQPLFDIDCHAIKDLLSRYHAAQSFELPEKTRKMQVYLSELRNSCYRLISLGASTIPEFYEKVPPDVIYTSLFRQVSLFDAIQMRQFLRKLLKTL